MARGRGTKAEGRWQIVLAPEVERGIVRDYCTPGMALKAIEVKWGVTEWTVNKVRLKWGLRRQGRPGRHLTPALRDEPVVTYVRCPICLGRMDLSAPHRHGAAA